MSAARVLLQDLRTREVLDWSVPLVGAEYTRTLSGPQGLTGNLPEGYSLPVLEWGSALWVESDGEFKGGGVVTSVDHEGRDVQVACTGVSGYASKMPWLAPREDLVQVDPLGVVRKVWAHLQSYEGGNLYLTVDSTTSPVRVGEEERDVEFSTSGGDEVSFQTGPFRLNPVDAQDLGKVLDDLAADTPFDYLEETYWDGRYPAHRLRLGYPSLGVKRNFRYRTGENLAELPSLGYGDTAYASDVLLVGAGEGREAVSAHVPSPPSRLRRVAVVVDKSIRSKSAATRAAREDLAARTEQGTVSDFTVVDSPEAPLAELNPGDQIHVSGPLQTGAELDHWVRVVEITYSLDDPTTAALTVTPV